MAKRKTETKQEPAKKPTPAFLKEDYPYPTVGEQVADLALVKADRLYEIKCPQCQTAIRTRGEKAKETYQRLTASGCVACGNRELVLKEVDMSRAQKG